MNLIEQVGYDAPNLLMALNSILLLNQKPYLLGFVLFFGVDYQLVGMLKNSIREPRPPRFLEKQFDDGGYYSGGVSKYGMPSGHSAIVWYATIYTWLVKQSPYLTLFEIALCVNTMHQRWAFHKHTVEQLLAGAVLGGTVAFVAFTAVKQLVKWNSLAMLVK